MIIIVENYLLQRVIALFSQMYAALHIVGTREEALRLLEEDEELARVVSGG